MDGVSLAIAAGESVALVGASANPAVRGSFMAINSAVQSLSTRAEIWGYEVWTPLRADRDIRVQAPLAAVIVYDIYMAASESRDRAHRPWFAGLFVPGQP